MFVKRILWMMAIWVLLSQTSPVFATHSICYSKVKRAGIWLNVVTVDLNSPDVVVTPAVARYGIGHSESFRSMLKRTRPAAAVDGTFFCTRTFKPTGDIIIDGRSVWKGYLGAALTIDWAGKVKLFPTYIPGIYDRDAYQNVVEVGPTLVLGGRTIVMPGLEGFHSRVHTAKNLRAAVGITYSNKLIFALTTKPVHLRRLAWALEQLKCKDAACLDGGSSSALYCKGKLITNPSRGMTNCILAYDNPGLYARAVAKLSPLPAAGERRADSRSSIL